MLTVILVIFFIDELFIDEYKDDLITAISAIFQLILGSQLDNMKQPASILVLQYW